MMTWSNLPTLQRSRLLPGVLGTIGSRCSTSPTTLRDQSDARHMSNTQIAALALELMPDSVEQKEWWAQHTAVACGQHAGLRVPGRTRSGDFQLSPTRTVPGDMDGTLQAWLELVESPSEFGGVPSPGRHPTPSADRWRYWRVALADGTR